MDLRGGAPSLELDRTELPGFRVARTFAVIYPGPRRHPRTAPALFSSSTPETRPPKASIQDAIAARTVLIQVRRQWRLHRPASACRRPAGHAGSRRSRYARHRIPDAPTEADAPLQCDGIGPPCTPCQGKSTNCSYGESKRRSVVLPRVSR